MFTRNYLPLEEYLLSDDHWQGLFFSKLESVGSLPSYGAIVEDLVGQLRSRSAAHEMPVLKKARVRALFQFNTSEVEPEAADVAYAEALMQDFWQAVVPVTFALRDDLAARPETDGALYVFEDPRFPEKAWHELLTADPRLIAGTAEASVMDWPQALRGQLAAAMHGRTSAGFKLALIHIGMSPVRLAEFGRQRATVPAQMEALSAAAVPAPANPELALYAFGLHHLPLGPDEVRLDWFFATDEASKAAALAFGGRFGFVRNRWHAGLVESKRLYLDEFLAQALQELWSRYPDLSPWTCDSQGPLKPLYPIYAEKERVVVLGLNPSYNPNHRDLDWYEADYQSKGYFKRMADFMQQVEIKSNEMGKNDQTGFFTDLQWTHVDLLYMRTTSQQQLIKDIWEVTNAAAFVWEQLQLTKKVLAELQPSLVIVANGFGKKLTGFEYKPETNSNEWMGLQFAPITDGSGAYEIIGTTTAGQFDGTATAGLLGVPVFFTGSFAGTNVRSKATDEMLATEIAALYNRQAERRFNRTYGAVPQ